MSTSGCSLPRGDTMMHVGGYHEYIGGCSVHCLSVVTVQAMA